MANGAMYAPPSDSHPFHPNQDVTNIPAAAAATMTTRVTQPRPRSSGGFVRSPITLGSLVNKMTSKTKGGASTPLSTAVQKNILTVPVVTGPNAAVSH
jgi:hypothetical protein